MGLRLAGKLFLSCSNCRAALVEVWRTRPDEPETWALRATCPFCGDASFAVDVAGGFHYGGVAPPGRDDPDEDGAASTVVTACDVRGGVFEFIVEKASPHARPYRLPAGQ